MDEPQFPAETVRDFNFLLQEAEANPSRHDVLCALIKAAGKLHEEISDWVWSIRRAGV